MAFCILYEIALKWKDIETITWVKIMLRYFVKWIILNTITFFQETCFESEFIEKCFFIVASEIELNLNQKIQKQWWKNSSKST